ncbi:hypothetical protein H9660_03635 [Clostridium sp. Sa3CUN1]|uniref:Uncharacterized protein n=1 Tax=Clostridium gallinarum TaxID=2762246 RepID=A0ABR8Q1D7_9CLOT|nr:hypothetical protein [Clostridium gallinarum]MBD7914230.1 hypothetical protein [Clostridium gallinarum]
MDKEKAKELIEEYKNDGFPYVDVELNDERVIKVSLEKELCRYGNHFLKIMSGDLFICIRYSTIKSIAI